MEHCKEGPRLFFALTASVASFASSWSPASASIESHRSPPFTLAEGHGPVTLQSPPGDSHVCLLDVDQRRSLGFEERKVKVKVLEVSSKSSWRLEYLD